jgi:hypothetical protein
LNLANLFAFGVQRLMPHEPSKFILDYVDHILIKDMGVSRMLPTLLENASSLAHSTSILHISSNNVDTYTWSHPTQRPFGIPIPIQCDKCLAIRSLDKGKMQVIKGKRTDVWTCKTIRADGNKCTGHFEAVEDHRCEVVVPVGSNGRGQWLVLKTKAIR